MIISLSGYMGSGKSHIANLLSERLNFKLIDLDKEIISRHKTSISEIFEKKGEIYFRKIEREILEEILAMSQNTILSLGGGTPVYNNNIEVVNDRSESIFLRTSVKTLTERLSINKSKRPLIANLDIKDLPEFIAKHLFERTPYYSKSKFTIDTDNKTPEEIIEEIILLLDLPPQN